MEKIKMFFRIPWVHTIFKILKWAFLVLIGLFIILVIGRWIYLDNQAKTDDQVRKIHNTKLTLDDVMGKNLPSDPGALADATVQGIDANQNGIRDDVELAVFKEYPNSAKTRAVLLQYALALQMEVVQPMVNKGTVGEIANKQDRSIFCIAEIVSFKGEDGVITAIEKYGKFVFGKQFNTEIRKSTHKEFYSYLKSGRIDDSVSCDIELSSFVN
ncbi:MAG: hypothetical protein NT161_00855 [Candidatus Nomurabacteria bacterium]|nr:hypothetical protein [Candidatus Nomurabacteria bacterium]